MGTNGQVVSRLPKKLDSGYQLKFRLTKSQSGNKGGKMDSQMVSYAEMQPWDWTSFAVSKVLNGGTGPVGLPGDGPKVNNRPMCGMVWR
jgi:hypothetical protein